MLNRSNKEMFSILNTNFKNRKQEGTYNDTELLSKRILNKHFQIGRPRIITEDNVNRAYDSYIQQNRFDKLN